MDTTLTTVQLPLGDTSLYGNSDYGSYLLLIVQGTVASWNEVLVYY